MNSPSISIIIPAYNEEFRLARSLNIILNYLEKEHINAEILVVDDGSKDKTSEAALAFGNKVRLLQQVQNMGKGAAVRRGMLEATGDICLFTDADLSTPIYEIKKVIHTLSTEIDVFVGSRALDYSMIKKHQPKYREFMGKTFNFFVQMLVMKGIKDTQCGFKAFKCEAAKKIFSIAKINGFGFDVEILYLARKNGYKIAEIPVEWYNDESTTVSPIKDSVKMFWEIIKVRILHPKN